MSPREIVMKNSSPEGYPVSFRPTGDSLVKARTKKSCNPESMAIKSKSILKGFLIFFIATDICKMSADNYNLSYG